MSLDLAVLESTLRTSTIGRRLVYLTSTSSTQDVARAEAEAGSPEGTAVVAEEQTAGRGRFGRKWESPAGKNIYVTLLLRPDVARLRRLGMIAPLSVCLAVEETTGLAPRIKWPNDVLLAGRKLSGMIVEAELAGSEPRYALLGIGVNVNYEIDPASEIAGIATSLKQELGGDVSRETVLAALLNHFEALYEEPDVASVHAAWKTRLETLGRAVQVTFRGETVEGQAEDVDSDGNLVLLRADGTHLTFEAGEVSLRAPDA